MTLVARMGLRAGEVAGLGLDEINWRRGEITIRGKRNRLDALPLPADVGEAIASYLQEGRPATREALTGSLDLRHSLGFTLERAAKLLEQFITYLQERHSSTVTVTDALAWARWPSSASPGWLRLRMQVVRGFAAARVGTSPCRLDIAELNAPVIAAFLDHLEHDRANSIRTRNARLALDGYGRSSALMARRWSIAW